jgi:glycosyltransferase involved in cell wall biosynthesis
MSESAAAALRRAVSRGNPDLLDVVTRKVEVVLPPQPLPDIVDDEGKFERPALELVFVGRDFLRKGGYEFLLAAERLLDEGAPIRLHLVSPMRIVAPDQPWSLDAEAKLVRCKAIVSRLAACIDHHMEMPNNQLLNLFGRAHVHVLASYHDTFGYSILEAQSRMCPTVTTTQRAFPEINNNEVGWLLDVPFDYLELLRSPPNVFFEVSDALTNRVYRILSEIVEGGVSALKTKALAARARVKTDHDPCTIADKIYRHY